MNDKLTNVEQSELAECEAALNSIVGAFYQMGQMLMKLRDGRLYRATHETFAEYCKDRWDMTRRQVDRLIETVPVIENLRPIGLIPATESQARELASLDPDAQRKVWETVLETAADGLITAARIRETRESLSGAASVPVQEALFDLDDYRKAIKYHVDAANHHIRQATRLRRQAFKQYGVQIDLPFESVDVETVDHWPVEI